MWNPCSENKENAVSISYAAVELAKKVFDTLEGRTVMILGAGKMSELTAKHLVSNGVKYGGDGRITLHIDAGPNRVRAEIVDQGSGFEPQTRATREMTVADEGGWGLHLVETLADKWGVYEGSTHVWFEIRRD